MQNIFPKTMQDIPEKFRLNEPLHQNQYLINGTMHTHTGTTAQVLSPVCLHTPDGLQRVVVGSYPVCGVAEAMQALDAATKAYDHGRGEWVAMGVAKRIGCIEAFVGEMMLQKDEIVRLLMWEIGKPHADSIKEFDRTVKYIHDTIDALKDIDRRASTFEIEEGIIGQIRRSPLGVVLCMGPFNYPLNETYTTLIPALIMGNTVLFKPPKHGTLLHFPMLEAFKKCFPKGVINTVYGKGAEVIPPLMQSGKIDVLTLIGSSKVANELKKMHPKTNRLRAILGLDAKNAGIVLKDANMDLAIKECVMGALSFNGQRCTALKILFVHESLADEFVTKFCAETDKLKLGMPWTEGVNITPLPEPNKPAYIAACIADAQLHGAKIMNQDGGTITESIVKPAVMYPVNEKMKLYSEEQFGPIVPIVPFKHLTDVIEYIIDADSGQQVSIFSSNATQISKLIDVLVNQVSRVNINAQCQRGPDTYPFTGRKDSAEGTLSVSDALRSFSIRTVVATKQNAENKAIFNEIIGEQLSDFVSTRFLF
jgi:acyl-CoA reductase-like NAD-dependent aldehyde dehydrogenase